MRVIKKTIESEIATVYIAENERGSLLEFVESTQPPLNFKEKWVLVLSTLYGCPVNCTFCDAGGSYQGVVSLEDLAFQVDYAIKMRFPDGFVDSDRFKIQFARMGEPTFNRNVLDFLRGFPERYKYREFIPSLSTIAPASCSGYFKELLEIKKTMYDTSFQLQFSIHSSDFAQRSKMIPVKTWTFDEMAEYGSRFYSFGGKKISLNFALNNQSVFNVDDLRKSFNPDFFLIKLTPLNPTFKALSNGYSSLIVDSASCEGLINDLGNVGYDTILSIGESEENSIGSNCGQYIHSMYKQDCSSDLKYTYPLVDV